MRAGDQATCSSRPRGSMSILQQVHEEDPMIAMGTAAVGTVTLLLLVGIAGLLDDLLFFILVPILKPIFFKDQAEVTCAVSSAQSS